MSERKVRKKRKEVAFTGEAVKFKSNSSPLHFLKVITKARWSLPSGIGALLLMVYVFVYSSDFVILLNPLNALESLTFSKTGAGVEDIRSDDIEKLKSNIGIAIYVCVLFFSLFFIKQIVKVLCMHPHIILIIALLLFGMTYSVNPQQVLYSVIQIFIGILVAIIYAIQTSEKDRWDRLFCLTILFPLFMVHLCSLILFFANGLNIIDFVEISARFGGLSGNPNVAGASAVIGTWASLYLLLNRDNSRFIKYYCVFVLCLFAFSIVMSGSGTSISVSLAVVFMLVWLRFLSVFDNPLKRTIYITAGVFIMTLVVGFIMINNSTEELAETFTSSLGKDTDLTGRTGLWEIAVDAIEEKPLLGWSFDQHETVQENSLYELPFGLRHFHNGFLDTAVAGGLILLVVVIWNLFSYVRYSFKIWTNKNYLYGFIGPVVLLIFMNLSEYSLLRPLSVIFEIYLCAYFLLVFSVMAENEASEETLRKVVEVKLPKIKSDRKRSSDGGKRYRF